MELQTTTRMIGIPETVFDDAEECPIDCAFTLPDYLPEIAAVLKCLMKPVIQSHQISGDRVMADGTVYLQLLYLDEGRNCVHRFEYAQPFTATFTVKDMKSTDDIELSSKSGYLNCRATGPRSVDVHGAFSVRMKVCAPSQTEVVVAAEENGLFCRHEEWCCTMPEGYAQKQFTVNEVLETGALFSAEQVLRNESAAVITDCKQMPEKAIVKGDILLKTFYVTDEQTGAIAHVKNRIPFSQIIDMEGLTEQTVCDCRAELVVCDVHVTQNAGGNTLLSVTVKVSVVLRGYTTEHGTLLTDAFHIQYPMKTNSQRLTAWETINSCCEMHTLRQAVDLPDSDVVDVLDVWCEVLPTETRCNEEASFADMRLIIGIIARDSNGKLSYYERTADATLHFPDVCEQLHVSISLIECDYTVSGKRLELQLQLSVCRECMVSHTCLALTELTADETAPYTREKGMEDCSLKVYFAGAGESLWEIAKAEHASPRQLQEENELLEDILTENTMLLIPLL